MLLVVDETEEKRYDDDAVDAFKRQNDPNQEERGDPGNKYRVI
jgi:hypothetical protein